MGHVLAQLLQEAGLRARVGLDGHEANHDALLRGAIDLYVEYTGTAQRRYLGLPSLPRDDVYEAVKREAEARWDVRWCAPLGFDNTFAVIMTERRARSLGVTRASELTPHAGGLRLGAGPAFFNGGPTVRFAPDGYAGLCRAYGYGFGSVRDLPDQYGATYDALHRGDVDVIVDFPLHPRMIVHGLRPLHDDQRFFSSYQATPVVRGDFLRAHPEAERAIARLAGRVDDRAAAWLNYRVEVERLEPRDVAVEFVAAVLSAPGGPLEPRDSPGWALTAQERLSARTIPES